MAGYCTLTPTVSAYLLSVEVEATYEAVLLVWQI